MDPAKKEGTYPEFWNSSTNFDFRFQLFKLSSFWLLPAPPLRRCLASCWTIIARGKKQRCGFKFEVLDCAVVVDWEKWNSDKYLYASIEAVQYFAMIRSQLITSKQEHVCCSKEEVSQVLQIRTWGKTWPVNPETSLNLRADLLIFLGFTGWFRLTVTWKSIASIVIAFRLYTQNTQCILANPESRRDENCPAKKEQNSAKRKMRQDVYIARKELLPRSLTARPWKVIFPEGEVFQPSFFRGYLKLQGCICKIQIWCEYQNQDLMASHLDLVMADNAPCSMLGWERCCSSRERCCWVKNWGLFSARLQRMQQWVSPCNLANTSIKQFYVEDMQHQTKQMVFNMWGDFHDPVSTCCFFRK